MSSILRRWLEYLVYVLHSVGLQIFGLIWIHYLPTPKRHLKAVLEHEISQSDALLVNLVRLRVCLEILAQINPGLVELRPAIKAALLTDESIG